MDYEAVIGLEIHAQLLTASKLFCGCSTRFGDPPNNNTCPVCLGMPGILPVLNKKAVEFALRMAIALHCRINPRCRFARKNYFYPDLPKGYQISQYELPLAEGGYIDIEVDQAKKRIGITRVHLEEDAGKLLHEGLSESDRKSYIDFNRCGIPLIEIVSEPEIRAAEEAREYLTQLKTILQYLEICSGNMEEGSLRCDANISIRPAGSSEFMTKTELKNMNTFRGVQRALEYEMKRQAEVVEKGGAVERETRLWDAAQQATIPMRGKEEEHDYRYFPEPDLVRLVVDEKWVKEVARSLPELPVAKRDRFVKEYGIPKYDAVILTQSPQLADYYEECVKYCHNPKAASNWIMVEVLRKLKEDKIDIAQFPIPPKALAELISLIDKGTISGKITKEVGRLDLPPFGIRVWTISGKIAKEVFEEMYRSKKPASEIVQQKGMVQITDEEEIGQVVSRVVESNPKQLEQYRSGRTKLFGYFMGEVMKATRGKANPQLANKILKEILDRS